MSGPGRQSVLSVVLLLLALPEATLAHGGGYTAPPVDTPGSAKPTMFGFNSPAGSGGSPVPPGGLSSGSHAGSPPTPNSPTGSGTTSGSTNAVQASGRTLRSGSSTAELASASWQYWWEFNKDRYLGLKSLRDRLATGSSRNGHLTGRGRRADSGLFVRPDPALIRRDVLPLLIRLLETEQAPDILDSSMLALARSSDEDTAQFVIDAITPFLAHRDRVVRRAAALSLGVLGSPRAVPVLTELMRDSSKGRILGGSAGPLDEPLRAAAALGLGLIDHPDSVDALCTLVEGTPDREPDLKAAAVAALGLMDNPAASQGLAMLVRRLGDRTLDAAIRSEVPIAIGKLCERMGLFDPTVEAALLQAFGDRDTDDRVRQSLAIALGLVGGIPSDDLEQDALLRALLDECAAGRSDATRELSFIAVAEVGRRDASAAEHPRVHQALRALFIGNCIEPAVSSDRAWAALGSAIYGLGHPEAQPDLTECLITAYSNEHDPSYKGAFALALGLLDARGRAGELFADLQAQHDEELNGFTALALGFMSYTEASPVLRERCQARSITVLYRTRLASTLALMADDGTDEALIHLIGEGHSVGVDAAAAKALGLVGGAPALQTLLGMAADERRPDVARAFACVAVGLICEKTALPWNARLLADCNFLCLAPTLREALDIL